MAGAGAYPAGIGPAGFDPADETDAKAQPLPVAAFYDPALRGFPINDDGEVIGVHPVDQEVAIRTTIPKGSLKCAPNVGIDWARIRRASKATMLRDIEDEVRTTLKPLIDAGDIRLDSVTLWPEAAGRPLFFVDYFNVRLGDARRIARSG